MDLDGYLDVSRHEISVYDGSGKLHFMSFEMPWTDSVTADAYVLIEALNAMSDVLQPTELASAAP